MALQPLINRQHKKEAHRIKRKQVKKTRLKNSQPVAKGELIIQQIAKTIQHFFPDLWSQLDNIIDPRKKSLSIPSLN